MFYGSFGPELGRERRAQIRREVRRYRLEARLASASAEMGAGSGEPPRREGLLVRGAAAVVASFR